MADLHWGKRNTPRKRKKYVFRERAQQKIFASVIRMNEDRYPDLKFMTANANGEPRDWRTGKNLKEMLMRPGFPDIIWLKIESGLNGLAIEMKHGNGKLSDKQEAWRCFLANNGILYRVCYGALDALEAVEDYASIQLHGKPSRASLQ